MIGSWTCPLPGGGTGEEMAVSLDRSRAARVLVCPAFFDEANKLRRFTIEVMRRLDESGIDTFLPDLPGCNESLAPLGEQTIDSWRECMAEAATAFGATHVLAIRAGAVLAPPSLPGWRYAPQTGARQLRAMIRARMIAAREDGRDESSDALMDMGRREGLVLAGWQLGAEFFAQFANAAAMPCDIQRDIAQSQIGGGGLWMRAEPDHDPAQAAALAVLVSAAIGDAGASEREA